MDDYLNMMGGLQSPLQGFTGAVNLAQGLQQMQAAEQAKAQAEQAAMMRQQKVQAALANPTAEGINGLALEFPDLIEPVKQYWSSVPKAKKDADLSALAGVTGAIINGRSEVAVASLKARIQADRDAGEESAGAEALLAMIEAGEVEQAKGMAALLLGAGAGEDAVKTILGNLTEGKVVSPGASVVTGMSGEVFRAPDKPEYKTVTAPDGSDMIVAVGGSGGAGPMAGGPSAPRSVRNNNPGNIRDGEFAKSQPGYVGTDGAFAQFETPEAGAAAQGALLASYMDRGFNSVGKIISRWAPPSDGNDTSGYIKTVADRLGVKPAQPLSKADIPRLQAAIAQVEGGGTPAAGPGGRVVFQGAGRKAPSGYEYTADGNLKAIPGGPGDLGRTLKPVPPAAFKAIQENRTALSKVEKALREATAYPDAFGGKNYVPDFIMQRADKEGVRARAAVADIGSLVINQRSGAAVSAAEFPRLAPFIPSVRDAPETVLQKLENMRAEIAAMVEEDEGYFSPENGYRPVKSRPKAVAPAVGSGDFSMRELP